MVQRAEAGGPAAASDGAPAGADASGFELIGSPGLPGWLAAHRVSLAFTTYQAGRFFLVGSSPHGGLSVFQRSFDRCMGLWAAPDGQTMWMSSKFQLWRFANALTASQTHDGYDRVYVPRTGHTTGDLDVHDVAIDGDGNVVFVATKFGCLATLSERHSFRELWRPNFLSRLTPEDRCHLNGMAMVDGRARYVTAVSQSDVVDGWRDHRHDGGVIVDVDSDEIIASGLSMPHSPRVYRDRLWVLNSGTGQLGYVARDSGQFEEVAFLPGFARGLTFVDNYAVVGLSQPRERQSFGGLALDDALADRRATAQCGLHIIDLHTGAVVQWLRLHGAVTELYDVAILPGARRPMMLGFATTEIEQLLSIQE